MWKKILTIICILSLLFVMTACSEKSDITSDEQALETQQEVSQDIADLTGDLEDLSNDLGNE